MNSTPCKHSAAMQRTMTEPLPSDPQFKSLDSTIIQLENEHGRLKRIPLQLRKRWYERHVPAYTVKGRAS